MKPYRVGRIYNKYLIIDILSRACSREEVIHKLVKSSTTLKRLYFNLHQNIKQNTRQLTQQFYTNLISPEIVKEMWLFTKHTTIAYFLDDIYLAKQFFGLKHQKGGFSYCDIILIDSIFDDIFQTDIQQFAIFCDLHLINQFFIIKHENRVLHLLR